MCPRENVTVGLSEDIKLDDFSSVQYPKKILEMNYIAFGLAKNIWVTSVKKMLGNIQI